MVEVGFSEARKGNLPRQFRYRSVLNSDFVLGEVMASHRGNIGISDPECRRRTEGEAVAGVALLAECHYTRVRASVTVL